MKSGLIALTVMLAVGNVWAQDGAKPAATAESAVHYPSAPCRVFVGRQGQKNLVTIYNVNGVPYAPLRFFVEYLGAATEVSEDRQSVTLRRGKHSMKLTLGETRAVLDNVNGRALTAAPLAYANTMIVPMSEITRLLGGRVNYGVADRVVYITRR